MHVPGRAHPHRPSVAVVLLALVLSAMAASAVAAAPASAEPRPGHAGGRGRHAVTSPSPSAAPARVSSRTEPVTTPSASASPSPTRSAGAIAVLSTTASPSPGDGVGRKEVRRHHKQVARHAASRPAVGFIGPLAPRFVGPPAPTIRVGTRFIGPVAPRRAHPRTEPKARAASPIATTLGAQAALRSTGSRTRPAPETARPKNHEDVPTTAALLPAVHAIVRNQVQNPAAPLTIAAIVVLFLLVQHRIDRRDPKLAAAVRPEPMLEFGSAVGA